MAVPVGFDETMFVIGGDPDRIADSAAVWTGFADTVSTAAIDVRQLDIGDFVGEEGDTFRCTIWSGLVPHLRIIGEAWAIVGASLQGYSSDLADVQDRMRGLRARACDQRFVVCGAASDAQHARAVDRAQRRGDSRLAPEVSSRGSHTVE